MKRIGYGHLLFVVAAALVALAACENKPAETKSEDPTAKSSPTNGAETAAATAAAPVFTDNDLSTPADFEESAEKAISKTNYKSELASLEADIAKE